MERGYTRIFVLGFVLFSFGCEILIADLRGVLFLVFGWFGVVVILIIFI